MGPTTTPPRGPALSSVPGMRCDGDGQAEAEGSAEAEAEAEGTGPTEAAGSAEAEGAGSAEHPDNTTTAAASAAHVFFMFAIMPQCLPVGKLAPPREIANAPSD